MAKQEHYIASLADFELPNSDLIERQVLSDIVGNPEIFPEVLPMISADMFDNEFRRKVWNTLVTMFNEGKPIDLVSVYSRVGKAYSTEVMSRHVETSTPHESLAHAQLLRDAATRRKAYYSALKLLEASTTKPQSEGEILSFMEGSIAEVRGNVEPRHEMPIADVINIIADETEEREKLAKEGKQLRVTTGFPTLDWLTYQGFGPGNLVILAARPSVGKTAIMLQMARAAAGRGVHASIFSLEMTKEELGQRMLYSTGLVSPVQVASGQVDWGNFERAASMISSLPIEVNDTSRECSEIISRIMIARSRGRCGIAFIDYLGLMTDMKNSRMSLAQSIGVMTGALKAAAKQAKIPIVLLCQLNRESAKDNRPPMLYDLRDSGSIEQDADIVIMLETADSAFSDTSPKDVNMWLRKNRQFKKDVCVTLRPNDTYSEFIELSTNG